MWSEHCSYKSSRVHLKRFPTTGPDVVVGPGENAGVVRLDGKLCVAFKMESHNHPSYIEPFQGAATGVGGILRDVFCMGARPIANLNCLRFGTKEHHKTPFLFKHVVAGIGFYGNCIGVPTVGGNISFNACYDGNCLVNAMTVGIVDEDKIFKGFASGVGNLVVYVGSATGRDGVHGATMASDSFDSADESQRSAVQVGDPFTEKLLLEATLSALEEGLVVGLQDMGAAGLTSSSFEMAARAGNGIRLDLDKVPVRAKDLTAYELMLSESQERMLMVVSPDKWSKLEELLGKWDLSFAVIGEVTNTSRVEVYYKGVLEVDLPVGELSDKAPVYQRPIERAGWTTTAKDFDEKALTKLKAADKVKLTEQLAKINGSKEAIFRQFDYQVGTKTVLSSVDGSAAVVWARSEIEHRNEHVGVAISTACNERYCFVDAKLGGAFAVLRAAREISAVGAKPLAVTDCLNFGNPEDPKVMAEFSDAVDGISLGCKELATPVISGNVSLYNETDGKSIYPTPMIGMVGRVDDVRKAVGATAKGEGFLGLIYDKQGKFGFLGSLTSEMLGVGIEKAEWPVIHWNAEREANGLLQVLAKEGLITACRPVGDGGLISGILKVCQPVKLGADINLGDVTSSDDKDAILFGEGPCAYVIHCKDQAALQQIQKLAGETKELSVAKLGQVNRTGRLNFGDFWIDVAGVENALRDLERL
jgi:phosphoribosylformylglycinamidine synthase